MSFARRGCLLFLFVNLIIGCAHPARQRHAENRFLPSGTHGQLIRNIPLSPAPSHTGLKPIALSLVRFWDLRRETRDIWLDYIQDQPIDELVTTFNLIEQRLAQKGVWVFNAPMSEEQLKARLDAGVPIIVFQAPAPLDPHHVSTRLLAGYRDQPPAYFVYDGNTGPQIQTQQEFLELHRNTLRYATIFCPAAKATWSMNQAELSSMAQYHEWRNEWNLAADKWRAVLETQATYSPAWVRLGNAQIQLHQQAQAMQSYRQAISADPGNGAAYNNLAFLLVESNPLEALGLAKQAQALHPADPKVLDTLALALMALDRPTEASAWLERGRPMLSSLTLDQQTHFLIRLAEAYSLSKQDHLARQVVNQIYRKSPSAELPPALDPYKQPHHLVFMR